RFLAGDALEHEEDAPFELVFEHTFFCAIPPERRGEYGDMAARLTRPGARLAAIVFPVGRPADMGGPPWGIATHDLAEALGARFRLVVDEPAARPAARRSWDERFALFERAVS
ncbi:MAG: TPMT family class I SAM-dependent methyltransferase, partial [Acidobacteriota bacterium]|nr:TPMT family class I SAM-dependent methyltransferase [Acidobacteriota bacterium]